MSTEQTQLDETSEWYDPETNRPDNEGREYPTRTCPMCGAEVKKLPHHLRNDCEGNE